MRFIKINSIFLLLIFVSAVLVTQTGKLHALVKIANTGKNLTRSDTPISSDINRGVSSKPSFPKKSGAIIPGKNLSGKGKDNILSKTKNPTSDPNKGITLKTDKGTGIKGKTGTSGKNINSKGVITTGKKPPTKPVTQEQKKKVYRYVTDATNLSSQEKNALNRIGSGQPLSLEDRNSLKGILVSNRPDMPREVRETVMQALNDPAHHHLVKFTQRFLRVFNDSQDSLQVSVQYRTWISDQSIPKKGDWIWSSQPVVFSLAPGKIVELRKETALIPASRVRIWAESSSGKAWNEYRNQDLWLVTEKDDQGERHYQAPERETFTFTFLAEDKE